MAKYRGSVFVRDTFGSRIPQQITVEADNPIAANAMLSSYGELFGGASFKVDEPMTSSSQSSGSPAIGYGVMILGILGYVAYQWLSGFFHSVFG